MNSHNPYSPVVKFGKINSLCLTAPGHQLNQYWLTITKILWHSVQMWFAFSLPIITINNTELTREDGKRSTIYAFKHELRYTLVIGLYEWLSY